MLVKASMNPSRRQELNRLAQDLAVRSSRCSMDTISLDELDYVIDYLTGIRESRFGRQQMPAMLPARPNTATGSVNAGRPPMTRSSGDIRIPQSTRAGKRSMSGYDRYENRLPEGARMPEPLTPLDRLDQDVSIIRDRVGAGFFDQSPGYYNPYEVEGRPQRLESRPLDMQAGVGSRDIDLESRLRHSSISRIPGQRRVHQVERFEDLPFNPQDERFFAWEESVPRGGVLSREPRRSRLR